MVFSAFTMLCNCHLWFQNSLIISQKKPSIHFKQLFPIPLNPTLSPAPGDHQGLVTLKLLATHSRKEFLFLPWELGVIWSTH